MFADSRRQPRFEVFDPYLAFAARYEVTVDGMEHNDFVSQGAIGKNDAVHRNYEAICVVILRFLDAYLKGDAQALASLQNPAEGGLLQLAIQGAAPVPPTSAQIVRMYVSEGPSNMQALSALVKNADPDLLTDAADLLFDEGRKREGCRPADLGRADSAEIGAALRARSAKRSRPWATRRVALGLREGAAAAAGRWHAWTPDQKARPGRRSRKA